MFRLKLGLLMGLLAGLLALGGCVQLAEDQPTPTPIPTPAESNKPIYEVKKGSIVQTVKGLGRVAASQEATLFFRQNGRMRRMYVETNQKVKEGDILAELETGTLKTQLAQARLNLDVAQLRLSQAMQKSGADTAVASAKATLESATATYSKAVGDLEKLKTGSTAADISSAQQAVVAAENGLTKAQTDLKLLRDGATPEAIRDAELEVEKAANSLWSKQISRDATCGRGPGTSCDAANADVAAAETALTQAKARLERVKAGPKPEEIANAERNVENARASLNSARARLELVSSGPKAADLEYAQKNVESAKAALEAAKVSYDQAVAMSAKGGDYEVQIQQKNVELARVALQVYEEQMELALIKAPFDGTVISTAGREGDDVKAYTAVVTVANPKTIQIALELQPTDLAKVQTGQEAVIVFSSFPTEKIDAKVVYIPSLAAGSDPQLPATQRTVRLDYKSPRQLELGALANVTISTQKKDDVLILPNTAIRVFGGRRFVRLATTTGRKQEVDIEVGISNETETEIVKGVREGQKVVGQ